MKKLLLLTTIILSSCLTEKRAIKKLALISAKHPNVLALSCADKFPNKETIEIRELISYDTIKSTDTLYKDSLINNEIIRYVYLPSKTITKTIKRDSVIRIENTAKVFLLENKIKELTIQNDNKTIELRVYRIIVMIFVLLILSKIILKSIKW